MLEVDLRRILSEIQVDVLRSRHTNSGLLLEARCPLAPWYHSKGFDNSPSFAAYVNESGASGFICKACHHKGRISNLIKILGKLRGKNYIRLASEAESADFIRIGTMQGYDETIRKAMQAKEMPKPIDINIYMWLYESATESPDACRYLESRGISAETAIKLGLKYDPEQERVLFPVQDLSGDLYGFSGRAIRQDTKPKIRDYAGLAKRHLVLGEHLWRKGRDVPLVIVEGLFGYAHLHEIGASAICNIGAIMGSEMTEEKANKIAKMNQRTFLLLDNDLAGDAGIFGYTSPARKLGAVDRLLHKVPLYIPSWSMFDRMPDGSEKADPDTLTLEEIGCMLTNTSVFA